jgi:hypothetical protein
MRLEICKCKVCNGSGKVYPETLYSLAKDLHELTTIIRERGCSSEDLMHLDEPAFRRCRACMGTGWWSWVLAYEYDLNRENPPSEEEVVETLKTIDI